MKDILFSLDLNYNSFIEFHQIILTVDSNETYNLFFKSGIISNDEEFDNPHKKKAFDDYNYFQCLIRESLSISEINNSRMYNLFYIKNQFFNNKS